MQTQAAQEAFALLDRLEERLSPLPREQRIARIRLLAPGESFRLSRDTYDCLLLAMELAELTDEPSTNARCLDGSDSQDARAAAPGGGTPPRSRPAEDRSRTRSRSRARAGGSDLDLGAIGRASH